MKSLAEAKVDQKWVTFRNYIKRKLTGMEMGIPSLDKYLLGLGGTVSIQGETSCNKSTLGLQIAHHNLKLGRPCIVLDKENGEGVLISRLLCQASRISETDLKTADTETKKKLIATVNDYPLYLYTEPVKDQELLSTRVRECWELHKKPVTLLVDSVQAMDALADDPRISLETWVYFLDRLKVELDGKLTVIMISEKNRASYGGIGVGGSKGSNVLDYKPETILDIRWKEADDTYVVKVLKHRHGLRGGEFELRKVLTDPSNSRSFCFLLEETDAGFEI